MTKLHPKENDVKREVVKLLDKHGWFHWGIAAGPWSTSGISDRMAIKKGRFLAIEVKLKKKAGTPLQEVFLDNVRKQGGVGFVIHQGNLQELADYLGTFDS